MNWGAVRATEVVEGPVEGRFREFMDSLLAGKIVPLLGSGVSADSVPTVKDLVARLKREIGAYFAHFAAGKDDFNRLAEVLQWQHGGAAAPVCKVLGIEDWADVPPTRAHRYLALLACEGVISDVITTNYDGGLERAWRQARGGKADGWEPVNHETGLGGGRPRWGAPGLRLYKINGCATRPKDAGSNEERKEERSREIQLTDLQIQHFGKRRWAQRIFEALFQDRELALSGFGSEEAQVWFVVMDILGELQGKPAGKRYLWVAEYSDHIGFRLLQALVGEMRVRLPGQRDLRFDNVFTKDDRGFFDGEAKKGLDAGDFWRRAWVEALRHGLTDRDGPVLDEFTRAATGLGFRSPRADACATADCWEDVVHRVFDAGPPWLEEPTRADGSSRWAKHEQATSPDEYAPCAPGLACLEALGGATTYPPLSEAPEYWAALILLLLAMPGDHSRMKGTLEDHEPCIEIALGDGGRRVTRAGSPRVRPAGPAITRLGSAPDVVLDVCIDLLGGLKDTWQVSDGIDGLIGAVRQAIAYPLQIARESEASSRQARRIPEGAA